MSGGIGAFVVLFWCGLGVDEVCGCGRRLREHWGCVVVVCLVTPATVASFVASHLGAGEFLGALIGNPAEGWCLRINSYRVTQ